MTPQELSELKSRCLMAVSQGYQVAHAETHVAELRKTFRDVPLPPNQTRALLKLIELTEALHAKIAAGEVHLAPPEPKKPIIGAGLTPQESVKDYQKKAAPPPEPEPPPEIEAIEDKVDVEEALAILTKGENPIPLEEAKKMLDEPCPETQPEPETTQEIPPPPLKGGKKGKRG